MANKNGIIINVGFDSDIKDYVNRIERQLKAVDWNGVLGLSESFNKEYEKITKQLQVLKKEISDLGAPDIHNMNNRLQSITQLTNRLTQQFDALVTSLPTDMQAKMNRSLTSVGDMLTGISEISNQASTAINGFTKAVVNSGNQISTTASRIEEIQNALVKIQDIFKKHETLDTGEFFNDKSVGDQEKMLDRLYDIYEAYNNASKKFSGDKKNLDIVKELQEQFYRFKELYNQMLDLDTGSKDSSQTQFWTNVFQLGDKSGAALKDVMDALQKDYAIIRSTIKKYQASLEAEGATFGADLTKIVKSGTKDVKQGPNGETIRLIVGVDDSFLNQELYDAIKKAQTFAEKNPIHVSVDISTKYRIRKDKENLDFLQDEINLINEEIEKAQLDGASKKVVTALQKKLENASGLFDKYFKGIDSAYNFHISLHTEYAMKQLSMFISQVKEQINKLKQDKIVFAPDVEIDEAFETRLKESTEKVLGKMQDAITKTADALDRLKVYFTEGIEMKPDFMKEERVTLGLLWQDLKKVYDQVVLVSEVFKSLAGEKITINNDMQTETLESLKSAMNSVSDVIGEEATKKIKIEVENIEDLQIQLHELKGDIDRLYETDKLDGWESRYLNAIKNIETAFEGLFGVKDSDEMDLISYFAKDIAMTDKAMMSQGRKIGEADRKIIYDILSKSGTIKQDNKTKQNILKALSEEMLHSSLEHGGYLTKDFKVGGLTSVDSSNSTRFTNHNTDWREYGAEIAEGILSSIHSHSGDEVWSPSMADLKVAFSEYLNNVPYLTTFARKEVSVIDTSKLSSFVNNMSGDDWEEFNKSVVEYAESIRNNGKEITKEVNDLFKSEKKKYSPNGRVNARTNQLISERIALSEKFKEKFGVGIDSFSKIYSLDEFSKAKPYGEYHKNNQPVGLSGLITTLQNVVQSATNLTQSLVNNNTQGQEQINSAILAQNLNKFDANELASAIKGSLDFSSVVESINGLPLSAIQDSLQQLIEITQSIALANQSPSTIQDQIKQLENAIQQDNERINSLRGNNQIAPSKSSTSENAERTVTIFDGIKTQVYNIETEWNELLEAMKQFAKNSNYPAAHSGLIESGKELSKSADSFADFFAGKVGLASPGSGLYLSSNFQNILERHLSNGTGERSSDVAKLAKLYAVDFTNYAKEMLTPSEDGYFKYQSLIESVEARVLKNAGYEEVIQNILDKEKLSETQINQHKANLGLIKNAPSLDKLLIDFNPVLKRLGITAQQLQSLIKDATIYAQQQKQYQQNGTLKPNNDFLGSFIGKRFGFKGINAYNTLQSDSENVGSVLFGKDFSKSPLPYIDFGNNVDAYKEYAKLISTRVLNHKAAISRVNNESEIDSVIEKIFNELNLSITDYSKKFIDQMRSRVKVLNKTLVPGRSDYFGDENDAENANNLKSQIEQIEKDRQQKIERLNYLKLLLQNKNTNAQENKINLADNFNFDSVDSNKLNELIQFLKTYVNLINKLANNKTMERVTTNITSLTQAISKFGGSKRKENPVLTQLENLMSKGNELQALSSILQKSVGEIQEAVNVVQNTGKGEQDKPLGLGHVEVNSEEWNRLIEKAKKFGITLENVDEIIRHVDNQGNESFRFIDKLGNIKTFGINSEEFKFIEEYVVKVKDSISSMKKEADSLPNIFQKAFRGDANAPTNIVDTLERISSLFAEISKYPSELTGDKSGLLTYVSNSIEHSIVDVNNLLTGSQKGKSQEFKDDLGEIIGYLKQVKELINSGEFKGASDLLNNTTKSFFNLGTIANTHDVKSLSSAQKLLGNINQILYSYRSMSHEYKQDFKGLSRDIVDAMQQYNNAIPSEKMKEFNERFLEIRSNALKSLRTIGAHFKRSALQLARMYLSWYRIIAYVRQGVQEVIEMDTALTKMSYTMNVTEEQLKSMSSDMINMAKDLATSVSNVEQIYQIYANLKTTQEELEKTAMPTAILSNLASVDASTAADQIQGVLNQFELMADDTMHIVDVYDKISANIKVDYSKGIAGMADAVQQVGNFANQAGLSFEQLAAIVGRVMQQTRQEGGQIGTALKTILTRISKASNLADPEEVDNATLDKASKTLHRIGVEVYTASGEFREFDTIMTELSEKWDTLSDAEQANISFAIAATRQSLSLCMVTCTIEYI